LTRKSLSSLFVKERMTMHFRSALVAALVLAVALAAAGEDKTDRDAFQKAQRQIRSRVASQRVEAIERLRDLPTPEAAKLLAPARLVDADPEVRRAAYETLLTWKDRRDICTYLLKILEKEGRGKKGRGAVVAPLVAVLLASEEPQTQRELRRFLDGYVPAVNDSVAAITAAADELARQADRPALATLERMTRLACFSSTFACRRAVVQAMIQIRLPQAIGVLTELLPGVDGEVRGDVVRHLAAVSGQQFGNQSEAWQKWWKEHKDGFQFPPPNAATAAPAAPPKAASYYGLAIEARRMVFVVDISGSMAHGRLQAAKRELTTAIDGLPPEAAFNLVIFSTKVAAWQRSLRLATPSVKQAARAYVYNLRAGGDTAAYDALESAFQFDPEAIYFLSDGDPNRGKIVAPAAIVAAVAQANRSRRISVYTIGIAPGEPGSPLDRFMEKLAAENFGAYRRVDF
jgi:hypothetical protein